MTRPFVDRPVTDRLAADRAASAAAERWRLSAPSPVRYGMNAVYRTDDVVLRVATPTAPGGALLEMVSTLARHGVPTPTAARDEAFDVGAHVVTAWRWLAPADRPVDWRAVGAAIRTLHHLPAHELPDDFPLATPSDFPWWDFESLLDGATDIDEPALAGLRHTVDRYGTWLDPSTWREAGDGPVVCHGDVVPPNVTMTDDGPVLVDFDLMSLAPAGWDHGPLLTWAPRWGGDQHAYDSFANGYGRSLRDGPAAVAFGALRLVAATLLRVRAAADDAQAGEELERRLRYWRDDPDPPRWRLA